MANSKPNTSASRTSAKIQNEQAQPFAGSSSRSPGPSRPRKPSKLDLIRSLLAQPEGATLDELVSATGWQPHSVRAGMTGLRKQGLTVMRTKVDGTTRFTIEGRLDEATA